MAPYTQHTSSYLRDLNMIFDQINLKCVLDSLFNGIVVDKVYCERLLILIKEKHTFLCRIGRVVIYY